jgi:nucleoside-diphosphate-sugar epimerase
MDFPEGAAGGGMKYSASKILAHQATLDWMKENNPQFSLVTLHPSFVLGHSLIQNSAQDIGGINAMFWGMLKADQPMFPPVFVDVRDIADAHLKAATVSTQKQTTEFLLSGNEASWDQVVSYITSKFPTVEVNWTPPLPGGPEIDTSRAENVLGMKWHCTEEIFESLISQQLEFLEK